MLDYIRNAPHSQFNLLNEWSGLKDKLYLNPEPYLNLIYYSMSEDIENVMHRKYPETQYILIYFITVQEQLKKLKM